MHVVIVRQHKETRRRMVPIFVLMIRLLLLTENQKNRKEPVFGSVARLRSMGFQKIISLAPVLYQIVSGISGLLNIPERMSLYPEI